jgi:hypothetical protein
LREACSNGFHAWAVATKLARAIFPIYQTKTCIAHASDTVHAIYQNLTPADVAHLGAVLSNPR